MPTKIRSRWLQHWPRALPACSRTPRARTRAGAHARSRSSRPPPSAHRQKAQQKGCTSASPRLRSRATRRLHMSIPDKIEKHITLRAPLARVWSAISDSKQFGSWFGCALDGPFVAGKPAKGTIQPTQVDPEVAKLQEPHKGAAFHIEVERVEPMRLFSFRWHPYAIEPGTDYSSEPMTLVQFELQEIEPGKTLLKITESGFDRVPLARRAEAFKANEGGWAHQSKLIEKYVYGSTAN